MVSGSSLIETIASKLIKEKVKNIVVDPVMVSTSGSKLLAEDATITLMEQLLPIATIITPNIPEAEVLSGIKIAKAEDMVTAAENIARKFNGAILIKGGHCLNDANDLLYQKGKVEWFYGERIDNPNTHGTGCTLSSAIASNLARGYSLSESVSNAKKYISGALKSNLNLGKGSGPLDHTYAIQSV
jgi:hydroxymethylpyrimidine/phosphomethylpyrimidine kinase